MFSKYKNTPKINSRRGSNNDATHVLDILYTLYPKSITIKKISEELQLPVNKINQSLQQIEKIGVPIEHLRVSNIHHIRANIKEPVFWIIKEKACAEKMLKSIKDTELKGNDSVNNQKKINIRIYNDYLNTLNDLFDKWDSLRLIDKLEEPSK